MTFCETLILNNLVELIQHVYTITCTCVSFGIKHIITYWPSPLSGAVPSWLYNLIRQATQPTMVQSVVAAVARALALATPRPRSPLSTCIDYGRGSEGCNR